MELWRTCSQKGDEDISIPLAGDSINVGRGTGCLNTASTASIARRKFEKCIKHAEKKSAP